jgi:nucleotidyltransferase substrate binding protein (TIGR01987 family)
MGLFEKKHADASQAWRTFQDILNAEYSVVIRDAAIQRFEYTTEALWKCLQTYLQEKEGIDCYSPKSCLREAKNVGLLDEQETVAALEMVDDRNMTSHTYHEELAEKIYRRLTEYAGIMQKLLEGMKI